MDHRSDDSPLTRTPRVAQGTDGPRTLAPRNAPRSYHRSEDGLLRAASPGCIATALPAHQGPHTMPMTHDPGSARGNLLPCYTGVPISRRTRVLQSA